MIRPTDLIRPLPHRRRVRLVNELLRASGCFFVAFVLIALCSAGASDQADAQGVDDRAWEGRMAWSLGCGALSMVCAGAARWIEARR